MAEPPLQPEAEEQPTNREDDGDQDGADSTSRRRTTRGRRGGSSRSSSSTASANGATTAAADEQGEAEGTEQKSSSRSRSRSGGSSRSTSRSKSQDDSGEDTSAESTAKKSTSGSSSRSSSRRKSASTEESESGDETATTSRSSRSRSRKKDDADESTTTTTAVDSASLLKALEAQTKQIEDLNRTVKEFMKNNGGGGGQAAAPPVRVGVFVDVANVELGADRARVKLHWGKILRLLSHDRQLVRAMAYAPVHDDPSVSRETQRFVEPFLDNGYKIVTKHLKRFSDGTIKANVDIEMTLDILNMLERLDVVCLVSGDGDFEPLVLAAQARGVRVVVVAMGNSCSNQLRAASDEFIDLQQRLGEVKA